MGPGCSKGSAVEDLLLLPLFQDCLGAFNDSPLGVIAGEVVHAATMGMLAKQVVKLGDKSIQLRFKGFLVPMFRHIVIHRRVRNAQSLSSPGRFCNIPDERPFLTFSLALLTSVCVEPHSRPTPPVIEFPRWMRIGTSASHQTNLRERLRVLSYRGFMGGPFAWPHCAKSGPRCHCLCYLEPVTGYR